MPREEMELDHVGSDHFYPPSWDEESDIHHDPADALGEGTTGSGSDIGDVSSLSSIGGHPAATNERWKDAAALVTTAAKLSGTVATAPPGLSPDAFTQGMTVMHPEHGPGKIISLSGAGDRRRAVVQFAAAGQRRFVLAHSPLRPVGS
jgi:DNA helicase-2/ATP-dependent DNA helicase PcrA